LPLRGAVLKRVLRKSLRKAYEQLVPKLARLAGHRIQLHKEAAPFETPFSYSPTGNLLCRLEAGDSGTVGYLEVDKSAKHDAFATKTITQFQFKAKRLFGSCSLTRHVEQTLLTGEQAFWDDLVVSFKYPKNSHYGLLSILWTLRQALHFRYENQLPQIGVLFTWNVATFLTNAGTTSIPMANKPLLQDLLRHSKAAHLLSDAEASIYVVRGKRAVQLLYRSSDDPGGDTPGWELVPEQYRWLGRAVLGRDLVIINSGIGEQLLISSKAVLKWVDGQWTRLSDNRAANLLRYRIRRA